MQRIILQDNSYVLQERTLFFWTNVTAKNENGDDIPCDYIFDRIEDVLEVADKDVMITKEVFEHNVEYKVEPEPDGGYVCVEEYLINL